MKSDKIKRQIFEVTCGTYLRLRAQISLVEICASLHSLPSAEVM